jgi:hypothetical protein
MENEPTEELGSAPISESPTDVAELAQVLVRERFADHINQLVWYPIHGAYT